MKFTNTIFGAVIATIGVGIGYVDYWILKSLYEISLWITNLLGAPASFAVFLTLILSWMFIILILIIGIIAIYIFFMGMFCMFSD